MEELQKHFPSLAQFTYLDTPSNGIIPTPVFEWRREQDEKMMANVAQFRAGNQVLLREIRETLSQFLGNAPDEIALVPNFSWGINAVLEGLPPRQKILALENDYPSHLWPMEKRGFDIVRIPIEKNMEETIAQAIEEHRPHIFAFSIVQWLSGIKIDLDFIKQIKRKHPQLLLLADATQYLGTEDFNFAQSGCDVLCASSYKWLTGGYGNGLLLVKREARDRISPKTIGFNSAETFSSKAENTAYIKHFEPGHLDSLAFGTLWQSVLFMQSVGLEKIYQHIAGLCLSAKNAFAERHLLSQDVHDRKIHSTIFNLKGDKAQFQQLQAKGIVCAQRGGGIRVGFHYYNNQEDLATLLNVLDQ